MSCTGGSAGVGGGSNSSGFNNEDRKDNSNDDNFILKNGESQITLDRNWSSERDIQFDDENGLKINRGTSLNLTNSHSIINNGENKVGILNEGTINVLQNGTQHNGDTGNRAEIYSDIAIDNKGTINKINNEYQSYIFGRTIGIKNSGTIGEIVNREDGRIGGFRGTTAPKYSIKNVGNGTIGKIDNYGEINGEIDLGNDTTIINHNKGRLPEIIKLGNGTLNYNEKPVYLDPKEVITGTLNSKLNLGKDGQELEYHTQNRTINVGTITVGENVTFELGSNKREYTDASSNKHTEYTANIVVAQKEFLNNGKITLYTLDEYYGGDGRQKFEIKTPKFVNNGMIKFESNSFSRTRLKGGATFTISGNYEGKEGSLLVINNNNDKISKIEDHKLHITGDASGQTGIIIDDINIGTNVEGQEVVRIDGTNTANFTLKSIHGVDSTSVVEGAYIYRAVTSPNKHSVCITNVVSPTCINPVAGASISSATAMSASAPTQVAATPQAVEKIYRPLVSMYVESQKANNEQGELALNNFTSREEKDKLGNNTWFRYYGSDRKNDGEKRFGHEQKVNDVQIGQDIYNKDNKVAGVFIDYSHADTKMEDRVREKVEKDAGYTKNVGKISSNSVGLGGYFTKKFDNSYIDGVLLLSTVENKFKDIDNKNATQKGYRIGSLVEYGHTLFDKNDLKVEGRAQLAYQRTTYKKFNDGVQEIKKYTTNELTGTVGTKVTKNFGVASVYGTLDIKNYFITPKGFDATSEVIKEKYDRTGYVAGIGAEFGEDRFKVYLDGKYGRSFKGHDREAKATLGFKFSY